MLINNYLVIENRRIIEDQLNIQALRSKDRQEIKRFVRLSSGWVYNLVLSYVHNQEDAEEIIQDTIIGALKGINSFRSEASIKTWVYQIASNKSKDFLKYKTRQKRSAFVVSIDKENRYNDPANHYHPGVILENKEDYDLLWSCIDSLPEKQRNALILAKIDKKSQAEIGVIMNVTTKAVESLLSRAKSNLKKLIIQNNSYGRKI